MELEQFCSASRVLIVAGKGGVGKTTVAATLAVTAVRAGMSVLIVEVEGKSGLTGLFDAPALDYEEIELAPGIRGPDAGAGPGARRVPRRPRHAADLEAAHLDGCARGRGRVGPGDEGHPRARQDQAARGGPGGRPHPRRRPRRRPRHHVPHLARRASSTPSRPVPSARQAEEVSELLSDPERCRVVLVTLPEETPVTEIAETAFALEDRVGVALGPVVVNGLYPSLAPDVVRARPRRRPRPGAGRRRRARRGRRLRRPAARAPGRAAGAAGALLPLHQLHLPFRFGARLGPADLDVLAAALADQVAELPAAALTP